MKKMILVLLLSTLAVPAFARDGFTHGYFRHNGTYVEGYHHTAPDNNTYNNYSTQGNVNPYTGQTGTVNPYSYSAPPVHAMQNIVSPSPYGYGN